MKFNNSINVIAQQFYGNRTGTEICVDEIDYFLKGILSPELFPGVDRTVDRRIVRIPNDDDIVVVYDQNQEDEYVNITFPAIYASDGEAYRSRWGEELRMHVSFEIPEIGFKIHTRCFACRVDHSGELQSLEPSDVEKFIHYFPTK